MNLLFHTYELASSGELYCVATGQSLSIHDTVGNRVFGEYRDRETTHRFKITLLDTVAQIDWNEEESVEIRESYGLWRRMTWFLLDALMVWLVEGGKQQFSVLVRGGWFNGEWVRKGRFESSGSTNAAERPRLAEVVQSYAPFPLDGIAPKWCFEKGREGALEGRIAILEDGQGVLPLADASISVADQLSQVPRFVGDDGTIFFFHRVNPWSGPDYSPTMQYGVATRDYAFYFSATHGIPVGKPIRLHRGAHPRQGLIREHLSEIDRRWRPGGERWRLHPDLREKQFFAGAEAAALSFNKPSNEFPEMRSIEHDQVIRFGYELGQISEAPMSVGFASARLSALPRLSTEPDEKITGFFAKRRELQRVRLVKERIDFTLKLLRGEIFIPRK